MTQKIILCTTQEEFNKLHVELGKKHRTPFMRVDVEALTHLLIDHSVMAAAISNSSTFKMEEPK